MDVADRRAGVQLLVLRLNHAGTASISYATINLRTVAERSGGGVESVRAAVCVFFTVKRRAVPAHW